ncbi:unnamed protein product [Closterium sp. NIES-65]|nr:unnamed protein product [Closterium sp. NIES-65]
MASYAGLPDARSIAIPGLGSGESIGSPTLARSPQHSPIPCSTLLPRRHRLAPARPPLALPCAAAHLCVPPPTDRQAPPVAKSCGAFVVFEWMGWGKRGMWREAGKGRPAERRGGGAGIWRGVPRVWGAQLRVVRGSPAARRCLRAGIDMLRPGSAWRPAVSKMRFVPNFAYLPQPPALPLLLAISPPYAFRVFLAIHRRRCVHAPSFPSPPPCFHFHPPRSQQARHVPRGARNEGWCDRELQGEGQGDQGQGGAQVQGEQAWRGEGAHRKASGAADSGSGSEKETGQGERARDGDESEENAHVDNALHDLPASWHWLVGRWARLGVQLSRMRSQWGRLVFGPAAEERIWSVPWQGDTIFQVMFLWFLAFWLIGSWLVPLLAQALGLRRAAMSLRAHALYSLLTDLAEMTVGIAILNRCLTRFQPLPPHWFPVHLSGRWYLQALLACSFFPFVQLLSKLNLQLLPLPLKFQATTHLEQSIHSHDPIATLLYAIAVAVCAPVWEEVVFRGFLLPSLTRYFPLWASVVVSAMVFALAHFSLQRMLPLFFLALRHCSSCLCSRRMLVAMTPIPHARCLANAALASTTLRLLFCASLVCAPLLVPASAAPGGVRWRDVDVGELGIMPSPLFSFDRAPPVIEGAALPRLGEIGEGAAGEDAGGVAAVNAWLAEQGTQGIGGPDAAVVPPPAGYATTRGRAMQLLRHASPARLSAPLRASPSPFQVEPPKPAACPHSSQDSPASATGAMLVARQPIAAAAAALLVPAPLQQTADGLAEGEARQLPYNVTRKEKPWTAASVLAAWLLRERAKGAKSKWAAFIGSLPRYAPLPALFEREVVEMLDYPPMMRRLSIRLLWCILSVAVLLSPPPHAPSLALYRAAFEEEYLRSKAKAIARASKSHFFWALSLVLSRALPLLPYTHMPHGLLPSQLPASAATASPVGKVVAAVRAKERGDDKEDATATAAAAGGAGAAAGAASEAGAAGSGGSSEGFCSASAGAGEGAASAQGCSAVQQQWVGTSAEELARSMQWHGTASDPHAPSDSAPPVTIRALSAIPANTRLSLNLGALSNDVLWALHGHLPAANPHDRMPLFHTPDSLLAFLLSLHPLSTPAASTSGSAAPSQWYDPGLSKEQEAALAAAVEAAEDAVHAEVMAHSSTSSGSGMAGAQQQYPVALSLWDEVDGGAYNAGADGQVEPRLVAALAALSLVPFLACISRAISSSSLEPPVGLVHAPRAPLFSAFSIFILASLFPSLIFPPPLAPSPRAWQPCWPDLDWQQLAQVAVSFSRDPFHPACPPPTASLSIPPHLVAPLSAAAAAIAKRAEQLLWAFSSSPQEDELLLQRLAACRLAPPPHSGPDAAGSVDGSAEREDGAAEVADSSKEAVEEEQGSGQGREGSAGKAGSGTAGAEGCKGVEFDASVCTAQVMRTLGQREMVVRFRLGKKLLLQRLAQRLDSGACIHGVVDGAGEAAAAATATAASS